MYCLSANTILRNQNAKTLATSLILHSGNIVLVCGHFVLCLREQSIWKPLKFAHVLWVNRGHRLHKFGQNCFIQLPCDGNPNWVDVYTRFAIFSCKLDYQLIYRQCTQFVTLCQSSFFVGGILWDGRGLHEIRGEILNCELYCCHLPCISIPNWSRRWVRHFGAGYCANSICNFY